jgi:mersacidin/lichenicidin family type 2 lantibiotic
MSRETIIRAWKDEDYWLSLSEAERAAIPDSPIGEIELSDDDLIGVAGGTCTCHCTNTCSSPTDCPTSACTQFTLGGPSCCC